MNYDLVVTFPSVGRFIKKGCKWYGWTEQEAQQEWDKGMRDPAIKKGTDQFGNPAMAYLEQTIDSAGLSVNNSRSIKENNEVLVGDDEALQDMKDSALLSCCA